jgi:hypothetical protein
MRKRQLSQDDCTAKVHLDRLPPFGRPPALGGGAGPAPPPDRSADAGVVDENVYRSQPLAQFGDGGGGGPPVGDVSRDGSGDTARPVDLADRGREFTRGPRDERDGRSGIGEPGAQQPAEASAAAAHQRDHAF